MSETIFIHCETYSRKANAAGQSVEQIIAEGLRQGDFHTHVSQPHKPLILMGDAYGFQKAHDDHIAARKTNALVGNKEINRAIRKDRHTLFTIIASFPKKVSEVSASNELTDRLKLWVRKTCKWVRKKYGEQLSTAE